MPVPAVNVAKYLVHVASQEPEQEFLSHLRLQKLLYYVQGWSLALRGATLFTGRIEAWKHGPVVPAVYHEFKTYEHKPIPKSHGSHAHLAPTDRAFVESVWEHYKACSAAELRRMTHRESPWLSARAGLGQAEPSQAEIPIPSIRQWFIEQRRQRDSPGLDVDSVRRAEAEIRSGNGVPLAKLRAERLHAI